MTVYRIPVTKEAEMTMIHTKPEDVVDLYNLYYHGVHVFLKLNREDDVDKNEE